MKLHQDTCQTLFSADQIAQRVQQLGQQITQDYAGQPVLLLCTLRGACVFFADLLRHIDLDVTIDFVAASSYGDDTTSSGHVVITKDISTPIEGKNVIIVEDIIDSGLTLSYLKQLYAGGGAKSIRICALLDKKEGRKVPIEGDYIGFCIPNAFVVGYGLDYSQRYRNLPDVCILDPKVYTK